MNDFKIITVLLSLLLVGGCAGSNTKVSDNVKPFGSVGIGHLLKGSSAYELQRAREYQCDNWQQAWLEAGLEFKNGCSISVIHQSWWFCGWPFNDRPEVTFNSLVGKCKIGGFKWP